MNQQVAHGAIVLCVSLATVGAAATSSDWEPPPAGASAQGVGALRSEVYSPLQGQLDVPIRSGRLADEVVAYDVAAPLVVRVAEIGLEAPVISVGVDENYQLDVPAADTVGWYRYSSSPGDPGASVLAAHVDYGGSPGAFYNLRMVLPGDVLEVEMDDGTVIAYEVTGNTLYDKTELPAGELFRKDGESVLQLITCGGTFDPDRRSYEANLVVTAVPVPL
jgi:sortase (surface protein transpeptidase)